MRHMRNILSALVALQLVVMPLCAQRTNADTADGLLAALSEKIAAMGDYRVEFSVEAEGNDMNGNYIVSGSNFRIVTPEFEVVSNGKARYEINKELEEVIVDEADTTEISMLINPTKAFEFAKSGFVASYGGIVDESGKTCDLVVLVPGGVVSSITEVKLYLDKATGLPVRLDYKMDGFEDKISVKVLSFAQDKSLRPVDFRFDKSKYPGYEVIDFR